MSYELSHDSIAQQIFQKAGAAAQMRRKVERFVQDRHDAFLQRGAPLTQDDIEFVWPYLDQISSSSAAIQHFRDSKQQLAQARQRRQLILVGLVLLFAALAIWALYQQQQAQKREQEAKTVQIALAARLAFQQGQPAASIRLAKQALEMPNAEAGREVLGEMLEELRSSPFFLEVRHEYPITAMDFAADSIHFLSADEGGVLRITGIDGKQQHQIKHVGPVSWAGFYTEDLSFFSLTATAGKLYHWNEGAGKLLPLLPENSFNEVALSPDRTQMLGISGAQVLIWNTASPEKVIGQFELPEQVRTAGFLPTANGYEIITASISGRLQRWTINGQQVLEYPNLRQTQVTSIQANAPGDKIVFRTGQGDFLADATEGDTLRSTTALFLMSKEARETHFFRFNGLDKAYSLNNDSSWVYQWNLSDPDLDIDFQWGPKQKACFVAVSPQAHKLLLANTGHEVVVREIAEQAADQKRELFRFSADITSGVFSPNQAHFLSSNGGKSALLWVFNKEFVELKSTASIEQLFTFYTDNKLVPPLSEEQKTSYQLSY